VYYRPFCQTVGAKILNCCHELNGSFSQNRNALITADFYFNDTLIGESTFSCL